MTRDTAQPIVGVALTVALLLLVMSYVGADRTRRAASPVAAPLQRMTSRAARSVIGVAIAVAFLSFVVSYVGVDRLLTPWQDFSLISGIVAVGLLFASYVARAYRVYDCFRSEMMGRFWACMKLTLYHIVANNFLPMRSGEISFPVLMSNYFQIPAGRSLSTLLWFRLLDLHTLLCAGSAAALWHIMSPVMAVGFLVLALPLPLLAVRIRRYGLAGLASSRHHRLHNAIRNIICALPENVAQATSTAWWTWINWLFKLMALSWVLLEFVDVTAVHALYSVILSDFTSILPLHSVGGFGTYEGGIAAGLTTAGVAVADALQAAVSVHLFLLGSSVLGGIFALFINRRQRLPMPEAERATL